MLDGNNQLEMSNRCPFKVVQAQEFATVLTQPIYPLDCRSWPLYAFLRLSGLNVIYKTGLQALKRLG